MGKQSLGSWWRSSLFLILGLVLLFLLVVSWLQISKSEAERLQSQAPTLLLGNGVESTVFHPVRLPYYAPLETGSPIIVRIYDVAGIGVSGPYTVTFSHPPTLLLTTDQGQFLANSIILTSAIPSIMQSTVHPRVPMMDRTPPVSIPLTVTVAGPGGELAIHPIRLALETKWQMRWRLVRAMLLSDLGLPSTLLLALVGYYVAYRDYRRQQEQTQKDDELKDKRSAARARLIEIDQQIRQGEPEGFDRLQELVRDFTLSEATRHRVETRTTGRAQRWRLSPRTDPDKQSTVPAATLIQQLGRENYQRVQDIANNIFAERAVQAALLRSLGLMLRTKQLAQFCRTTDCASKLLEQYQQEWSGHFVKQDQAAADPPQQPSQLAIVLGQLHLLYKQNFVCNAADAGKAMEALFLLWDQYRDDAKDVVVETILGLAELHHYWKLGGGVSNFRTKLTDGMNGPARRRILRDHRLAGLQGFDDLKGLHIQWPSIQAATTPTQPKLVTWLNQMNLAAGNPFCVYPDDRYQFDVQQSTQLRYLHSLLLNTWDYPEGREHYLNPSPTIIVGKPGLDRLAAAFALRHELLFQTQHLGSEPLPFVLWLQLPFENYTMEAPERACLAALASAAAESWCSLRSQLTGIFLNLGREQQVLLAQLLVWRHGSFAELLIRLESWGVTTQDVEGQLFLRLLAEVLHDVERISPPDTALLLKWMTLRPPDLTTTFVIVESLCDTWETHSLRQMLTLMRLATTLAANQHFLKFFVPPSVLLHTTELPRIELSWSTVSLQRMLNDRVNRQSEGMRRAFNALFYPTIQRDPGQLLAETADGSLTHMLKLAEAAILHQIERNTALPGLDEDEFERFLSMHGRRL